MTDPLPELMDVAKISRELGITNAAAERIMQALPKVVIPGTRKAWCKRRDVARLVAESTRT